MKLNEIIYKKYLSSEIYFNNPAILSSNNFNLISNKNIDYI